jgi:hypothetical protein
MHLSSTSNRIFHLQLASFKLAVCWWSRPAVRDGRARMHSSHSPGPTHPRGLMIRVSATCSFSATLLDAAFMITLVRGRARAFLPSRSDSGPLSSAILVSRSGRCSQVLHSVLCSPERGRRDVRHLSHFERAIGAHATGCRLADLHAAAPGYSSPLSRSRHSAISAADTLHRPPSAALLSTITTLLHSPSSKVNIDARRRSQSPPSLSHRVPLSSFSSSTALGLAPSFAPPWSPSPPRRPPRDGPRRPAPRLRCPVSAALFVRRAREEFNDVVTSCGRCRAMLCDGRYKCRIKSSRAKC